MHGGMLGVSSEDSNDESSYNAVYKDKNNLNRGRQWSWGLATS
jgi:hypothetical protein